MKITFRPAAVQALKPYVGDGQAILKLVYDIEGCGCVMDGVSALHIVPQAAFGDVQGEGDPYPFLYEPSYEVFFEPKLNIDYKPDRDAFTLSSDGQIYTNDLKLISR